MEITGTINVTELSAVDKLNDTYRHLTSYT